MKWIVTLHILEWLCCDEFDHSRSNSVIQDHCALEVSIPHLFMSLLSQQAEVNNEQSNAATTSDAFVTRRWTTMPYLPCFCHHRNPWIAQGIFLRFYVYRMIWPVVSYECETWSLTLREQHRLRVFEKRVLRRIFWPRRDGVTGECRKLHNEELNDLYSSPNIVRVIISRRLRWVGHAARMEEGRGVHKVLVGKPEGCDSRNFI